MHGEVSWPIDYNSRSILELDSTVLDVIKEELS